MLRESIIAVFTVALVGLANFGTDAVRGFVSGDWEAVVGGFIASITGLIVATIVLIASGAWLVWDDRCTKKIEQQRHLEIIEAVKSIPKTTILKAIQPEEEEQNGESKPVEPTNE